jgi:hypothetical protein
MENTTETNQKKPSQIAFWRNAVIVFFVALFGSLGLSNALLIGHAANSIDGLHVFVVIQTVVLTMPIFLLFHYVRKLKRELEEIKKNTKQE